MNVGPVNWHEAYKYAAIQIVEKLILDELDRMKGAAFRASDPFRVHPVEQNLRELLTEFHDRRVEVFAKAYGKQEILTEDKHETTDPSGGSSETSPDLPRRGPEGS